MWGPTSFVMSQAELALGSTARIIDDWEFQKKCQGGGVWPNYWNPDQAVKRAANMAAVRKLIWC